MGQTVQNDLTMKNEKKKSKSHEFIKLFIEFTISLWWMPVLGLLYGALRYSLFEEKPLIDYVLYNAVPATLILTFLLPLGLAILEIWERSKKH
jgi:hypothetical protein